jgi:hypothetical protein
VVKEKVQEVKLTETREELRICREIYSNKTIYRNVCHVNI